MRLKAKQYTSQNRRGGTIFRAATRTSFVILPIAAPAQPPHAPARPPRSGASAQATAPPTQTSSGVRRSGSAGPPRSLKPVSRATPDAPPVEAAGGEPTHDDLRLEQEALLAELAVVAMETRAEKQQELTTGETLGTPFG